MQDILIKGVTIVTPKEASAQQASIQPECRAAGEGAFEIIPSADIYITRGSIKEVRSAAPEEVSDRRPSRDANLHVDPTVKVIDAQGMLALPGFVNAHCHAAMTLFRGYGDDMALMEWLNKRIWPAEARLNGEDVYWGTLLACLEMIKGGVTAFADMYFYMDDAARAVRDSGIRASLSMGLVAPPANADRVLAQAEDFCQRWNGGASGRITTMLGPHAPYTCPPSFLEDVMELASRLDMGIHIHLSETAGEVEDSMKAFGKSPIMLMEDLGLLQFPVLAAHAVHVSCEDIEVLARRNVGVAHNPGSNMKLASGVAPVARMIEKGVNVGLGTDGAASNNNLDLLEEARLAALLHKVKAGDPTAIPAGVALFMATLGGARAMRLDSAIGSIEVGKKADIILLDMKAPHLCPVHDLVSNVIYSARAGDVATVIIDGQLVMEDRRILAVDEAEVMREVTERARRIAG